jgi:hypothetical protein
MTKNEEQALLMFERKIFRRIYGPKYVDGEWKSRTSRELEELRKGENVVKLIKGQRISWLGHLERMEANRMPKRSSLKNWKRKTQERMERRSRKRSSSAGSENMERVGDRWKKMETYCSTGHSPQRAVAPTEEEEDYMSSLVLQIQTHENYVKQHFQQTSLTTTVFHPYLCYSYQQNFLQSMCTTLLTYVARYSVTAKRYDCCPGVVQQCIKVKSVQQTRLFNPLNAELNPICHLLALLGAHRIFHVSRIRVNNPYFTLF